MEYIKDTGAWLKQMRETCDPEGPLTLAAFAEKLNYGWDRTIVHKIETGQRTLKADEFLYICNKFKYEVLTKKELEQIRSSKSRVDVENKQLRKKIEELEKENDLLKLRLKAHNVTM